MFSSFCNFLNTIICHLEILFSYINNTIACSQSESLKRLTRLLSSKTFFSCDMVEYYCFFGGRGLGMSSKFLTLCFYRKFNFSFNFFFYQQASKGASPWYLHLLRSGVIRFCSFSSHSSSFPLYKISSWFQYFPFWVQPVFEWFYLYPDILSPPFQSSFISHLSPLHLCSSLPGV